MADQQTFTCSYWAGVPDAAARYEAAQNIAREVAAIEAARGQSPSPLSVQPAATVAGPSTSPLLSYSGSVDSMGPPAPSGFTPAPVSPVLNVASAPAQQAATAPAGLSGVTTNVPTYGDSPLPSARSDMLNAAPALGMSMSDAERLVRQQYAQIGRAGIGTDVTSIDQPGLEFWRGELASGRMTPERFVSAFENALTAPKTPEEIAARTYGIYGRAGIGTEAGQIDPAGYQYWTGQLKSGAITPEEFAKRISYDLTQGVQLGSGVAAPEVRNYFYENKNNPYQVAEYMASKGLTAADVSRATGMTSDQVRQYFTPVFTPLGEPVDKPGRGVGGQYGSVGGLPILNKGVLDQVIDSQLIFRGPGTNTIAGGDVVNDDNSLGWDTASDNAQFARGNAAFGVERNAGAMGGGPQISGDLVGLAKAFGVDPNNYMIDQKGFYGPDTKVLDTNALYDAVNERTKDYYRVTGATGGGKDAAINRPDITGNHASQLYKAFGDKAVPIGDPAYFDAPYKVKSNALATIAMAIPMFFPGVGQAIGAALNLTGAAQYVVGNALFNAGVAAITGNDPVKGAISGAVGGYAQSMSGPMASNIMGAGDEALGATRIQQLAEMTGLPVSRIEGAISSSVSSGLTAAVLGNQDPFETFGRQFVASLVVPAAKDKAQEFLAGLDPSKFNKAAIYASNAAGSVANSIIGNQDVASNLLADLTDTHKTVNEYLGKQVGPELASTGNQIGDMFGTPEGAKVESENVYKKSQLFDDPNIDANAELHTRTLIRQDAEGGEHKYLQTYDPQTKEYGLYSIVMEVNGQPAYLTKIDEIPGLEETSVRRDDETKEPVSGLTIAGANVVTPFGGISGPDATRTPGLVGVGGATGCASTVTSGGLPSGVTPIIGSTTGNQGATAGSGATSGATTGSLPGIVVTGSAFCTNTPFIPINFGNVGGGSASTSGGALPEVIVTGKDCESLPPVLVTGGKDSLPEVIVEGEDCESLPPVVVIGEPCEPCEPIIPCEPCEPTCCKDKKVVKIKKTKRKTKKKMSPDCGCGIDQDWLDTMAVLLNTRGGPTTGPLGAAVVKPVQYASGGLAYAEGASVNLPCIYTVDENAPKFYECRMSDILQTSGTRKKVGFEPTALRQILSQISCQGNIGGMASGGLPSKYQKAAPKGHDPEFVTGLTGYYADGGGTGQSDDIPAMLHDGDYVMDAETVSALGDGSSKAGRKVLDGFRTQIPHKDQADGKVVPAKIADGEYVFPAAFVTALGEGDNKRGAEILDGLREKLRAHKRAAPLDKIPPKAKSPLAYIGNAKG